MEFIKNSLIRICRYICYLLISCFAFSFTAQAGTGWCLADSGTKAYSGTFHYKITDPTKNKAGQTLLSFYSWSFGSTYTATCDCTGSSKAYYKAVPGDLGELVYTGNGNYYKLNENIAIASSVFIGGLVSQYIATPFTDFTSEVSGNCSSGTYNTGNKGMLSLYISKAFTGVMNIPSTVVVRLYGTHTLGTYPSTPMAQVSMTGDITVPQSCKINDGQIIDIDYGDVLRKHLSTKGSGASGKAVVTQMAYVCTNMAQGVKISFKLSGQAAPDDNNSLATDNDDIGIRIEDSNGNVITPNEGSLDSQFNYATNSGTATFKSYPINTTGSSPEPGMFTSTATITTNIE